MSEVDHISPNRPGSEIFNEVGVFFDQNRQPLFTERRIENSENTSFYIVFGGIRMRYGAVNGKKLFNASISGCVQLRVALDKPNSFQAGNTVYLLNTQECNLVYTSSKTSSSGHLKEEIDSSVFRIDLSAELFFKYCPPVRSSFEDFRKQVQNDETAVLSSKGLPINSEMRTVIFDMLHCNKPTHFKHIYLKAKVVELLTSLLEYSDQLQHSWRSNTLKEEEMHRAFQVRKILDEHFNVDHTLLSLARMVGTNDASLKKHFKVTFGTTVFSYLTNVRMHYAKRLLIESKEKIQSIASKVGYKHATHFTAAFKRHFGFLPTKLRMIWMPLLMDICGTAMKAEWMLAF